MLGFLRTDRWRRRATWCRVAGLILLLIVLFAPVPAMWIPTLLAAGLLLFLFGSFVWLVRSPEPWLRRGP